MHTTKQELHLALRELARVAPAKPSMPILSHVLARASGGTLTLRAAAQEHQLSAELPADGDLPPTCLPLKPLAALAKPESKKDVGIVSMEIDGTTATIIVDGVTSRLAALDPADFPAPMPTDDLSLVALWPAAELRSALSYVLPAALDDVTRPHLRGVRLAGQRATTTDGHRLHLADLPTAIPEGIFLPLDAARALARVLPNDGPVVLAKTGTTLCVRCGAWTLDAGLSEAEFPEVDHAVPSADRLPTHIEVETRAFLKALGQVTRLSPRKLVKLVVNGVVTLSVSEIDTGEIETVVPVISNTHTGEDLVTGYNAAYLEDALRTERETVRLSLGGALDPMRVDLPDGRIALVMPVRV